MLIGIFAWIVVGLIVGFIAGKIVNLRGDDPRFGIAGAVAGSIVAAVLYTIISGEPIRPWNTWSMVWATIGAIVGTITWHGIRSRSISHDRGSVRYGHR